jgi:predicted transcriptional regulator of viral defense system
MFYVEHIMKIATLLQTLWLLDKHKVFVFTLNDVRNWFANESNQTLKAALARYVKQGIIEHLCRGVYLHSHAKSRNAYVLEYTAKALRRGHYNYISLESLLSAAGVISQVPLSVLTVVTTGRSQIYQTKYGTIEFTHTKRPVKDILLGTYTADENPLRLAKVDKALDDLKRVKRNTHLIDVDEVNDD